ncbi:hypothetical protein [Sutcliffiella cohnii]|nr:hypothetical protein [Sutcliffiella cohnii]
MKKRRPILFLAITFVFALGVVAAKSHGPDVSKQLADVRKATVKYHDIK